MQYSDNQLAEYRKRQRRAANGPIVLMWTLFLAAMTAGGMVFVSAFWRLTL
jgi:hypothetical protein